MLLDGKKIAEDIYSELTDFFKQHKATLGIIVVGDNPVIESFVRIKTRAAQKLGVQMMRNDLPATATTTDLIEAVEQLARDVDALIVQLPLPPVVDTNAVLSCIPAHKDVDAINPRHSIERPVEAPVALAVMDMLARSGVNVVGKRAVVVGAGRLVGAPTAALLKKSGAQVALFTLEEGSIADLKTADIIVSGAGNPGFIKPEHIKQGVALIDAGASEQAGIIKGDADPACADLTSVFSPVPGGVGPVAVAMIFRNLKALMENA